MQTSGTEFITIYLCKCFFPPFLQLLFFPFHSHSEWVSVCATANFMLKFEHLSILVVKVIARRSCKFYSATDSCLVCIFSLSLSLSLFRNRWLRKRDTHKKHYSRNGFTAIKQRLCGNSRFRFGDIYILSLQRHAILQFRSMQLTINDITCIE